MNWTAIAVTGLISATTTLIVMWLAYELVLKPRLQRRAEVLADELEARYELQGVVSVVKPSFSAPLPDSTFRDIAAQVDFVVVGVGV